jgi:hypothetical protein
VSADAWLSTLRSVIDPAQPPRERDVFPPGTTNSLVAAIAAWTRDDLERYRALAAMDRADPLNRPDNVPPHAVLGSTEGTPIWTWTEEPRATQYSGLAVTSAAWLGFGIRRRGT